MNFKRTYKGNVDALMQDVKNIIVLNKLFYYYFYCACYYQIKFYCLINCLIRIQIKFDEKNN